MSHNVDWLSGLCRSSDCLNGLDGNHVNGCGDHGLWLDRHCRVDCDTRLSRGDRVSCSCCRVLRCLGSKSIVKDLL